MGDQEGEAKAKHHEDHGDDVGEDLLDDAEEHDAEVAPLERHPPEDDDELEPGRAHAHRRQVAGKQVPGVRLAQKLNTTRQKYLIRSKNIKQRHPWNQRVTFMKGVPIATRKTNHSM